MIRKIMRNIFIVIVAIIIIYTGVIIIQKIIWRDKAPSIFGFKNYIVLSGNMEPMI